jgi:hypothetical protein
MNDFNALIAVLEQRDGYADHHLDDALNEVQGVRGLYRSWIAQLDCTDSDDATDAMAGGAEASGTKPKTCGEIKETLQRHANEMALAEDEARFRLANLQFYYDQYKDGITKKTPQIIPALTLLDSKSRLLTIWARSPFELIEMFLLVCMGLLGGVISVMRCFVDPSLKSPAIAEFFFKPAAGAAISLGVYVLFRATQIFIGVQNGPASVSTSIFLLAGLGLASGFCATQALATIESVAMRLLRSSGDMRTAPADTPRGSTGTPNLTDSPTTRPAAAPATPG